MSVRAPRVLVMRHGQTTANRDGIHQSWDPYPLTEDAVRIARDVAGRFGDQATWVVTSPILRARQSAELVWGRIDALDAGWAETAIPDLAGLPHRETRQRYPGLFDTRGWRRLDVECPALIESPAVVAERSLGALARALRESMTRAGTVAVATHGDVLCALGRASGVDLGHPGNFTVLEIVGQTASGVQDPAWEIAAVHAPPK